MSNLALVREKLHRDPPSRQLWHGVVQSSPTDFSDRLAVVVPEFDPNFKWEDCRWQARDDHSMPVPGDDCIVMISNRGEAWVISWWPF